MQNIPDTDLNWLTLSGFIPEEDFPSETFTIKLRVKRESGSTGNLWVGDMNVDIEEIEGEGDIGGTIVQANDYFYDNAGNLILVNSLGSGAAANVVQNPGFETGDLSGWYGYGSSTGVSDNFDEYEGEYSLVFSGNDSVCQEISLSETVSSPITISCWVEISSFWGEASFELKGVLKGDGVNEEYSDEIIAASCDWTQVSVTIDSIPEGTSSCEIKLIKTSGFGYIFVDYVVCELETEQEISTRYIYAGSRLLAKEENGDLFFYHLDRIGSPIMITDESGDVVKEKKYEAFGNLIWASDATHEDNREFTGKEKDPTGFHYFGARYYSGDIGRFLTPDPHTLYPMNLKLFDPQTLNPYVYCHNDPLNYFDPNGLEEEEVSTWKEVLIDAVERIFNVIDLRSLFKGSEVEDERNRSHNEELKKITEGTPEEGEIEELYPNSSEKLVQDGINRVFNNDNSSDSTDEDSTSNNSATQEKEEKSVGEKVNEGVKNVIKEEIKNRNRDDVIVN